MAKSKYNDRVTKAIDTIMNWCNHFGYSVALEGSYTVFISYDSSDFDIKKQLIEILMATLELSKKKVDSLISILETRGRVYIRFKKRLFKY